MLKLVFSMGVLALVIYFVDLREAARVALGVNPWYLIAFVVLAQLDRALMAYKWLPLLRVHKIKVPLLSATQMYSMSSLAGILLPSTVGGDVFRLYAVSRFKANTRHVLASIIVERALGLIALLILASISLGLASYLLKDRLPYAQGIWLALGVGGVFVLGLMGTLHPSVRLRLNRLVGRLTLFSFAAKLYRVYELSYEYRNHLPAVGRVFGLTFLEQLVPVATNFLLFRALGIEVSTLELLAIIPLIILAIRLPISFDGIGVQEGLYVGLFALVGVAPSEAILVSLITRVLLTLIALPWALHYVWFDRRQILHAHEGELLNADNQASPSL